MRFNSFRCWTLQQKESKPRITSLNRSSSLTLPKENSSLSRKTFSQVLERKYETDSKMTENWIIKSCQNLRPTSLFIVFRGCLSNKEIIYKTRKLQKKRKQNKITHKLGQIIYSIREEIAQIFEGEFRI